MISDRARPLYSGMVDDLVAFYEAEGHLMTDTQLFVEVSLRFGKRMLAEVCPKMNMGIGECSVGAIEIMREASLGVVKNAISKSRQLIRPTLSLS